MMKATVTTQVPASDSAKEKLLEAQKLAESSQEPGSEIPKWKGLAYLYESSVVSRELEKILGDAKAQVSESMVGWTFKGASVNLHSDPDYHYSIELVFTK